MNLSALEFLSLSPFNQSIAGYILLLNLKELLLLNLKTLTHLLDYLNANINFHHFLLPGNVLTEQQLIAKILFVLPRPYDVIDCRSKNIMPLCWTHFETDNLIMPKTAIGIFFFPTQPRPIQSTRFRCQNYLAYIRSIFSVSLWPKDEVFGAMF